MTALEKIALDRVYESILSASRRVDELAEKKEDAWQDISSRKDFIRSDLKAALAALHAIENHKPGQ